MGQSETSDREQQRCADCGEYVFFNHHVWSNIGNRTTHLGGCERAKEALREMPVYYDRLVQALVEIEERAGLFVSQADDEEWGDVEALQRVVMDVYHQAMSGIEAAA